LYEAEWMAEYDLENAQEFLGEYGLNVTFEKRKTRSQHEAQGASKKPN
jgi:hypothetical protein